jgi:hypothetical protein
MGMERKKGTPSRAYGSSQLHPSEDDTAAQGDTPLV